MLDGNQIISLITTTRVQVIKINKIASSTNLTNQQTNNSPWVIPLNTSISNNTLNNQALKNTIIKEGSHNLTKNYEKYKHEEDFITADKITKKITISYVSITALGGYSDFTLEELRSIDYTYKKTNPNNNFSILNKNEGMNTGWNTNNSVVNIYFNPLDD